MVFDFNPHLYDRTPPGVVEVKELPARVAYETSRDDGTFFDERRSLFRPLFGYLKRHDLRMTVPVEAAVEPATMRFLVEPGAEVRGPLKDEGDIRVRHEPVARVVSAGVRGGYTRGRFDEGRRRIEAWFAAHPDAEPAGPAEIAYWDGPMRLPFLRRAEVHVPLRWEEEAT